MKESLIETVRESKYELSENNIRKLAEIFKDRKVVMLGEASHGTHEYYTNRARLSKILIEEYDFDFIAVEGDWPACYQLNRFVKNYSDAGDDIHSVLQHFDRWPTWMWANFEIRELAEWMKNFNSQFTAEKRKGFYGLDVYSLWESLDAVIDYLEREDPKALQTARKAMRCFEPHRDDDGQRYAISTRLVPEGCRSEVVEMLQEIRSKTAAYNSDRENVFSTEQNAFTAKNAEEYYRVMVSGGRSTWNIRDSHMMETLERLLDFHRKNSKAIVWAHNTHIGDASYTDMKSEGLYNIGQLARDKYGRENVGLIGFGSYVGSVMAGDRWGANPEIMELPNGRPGSWEDICHQSGMDDFIVYSDDLVKNDDFKDFLSHRAIGVVYHPPREKYGNYVPTIIPERYDAFVFIDTTKALHAIPVGEKEEKTPETYPFGI